MALPQIVSRNQTQGIRRIKRGSRLTVFGSGGQTEAPVFEGGILSYTVPAGKNAIVTGNFIVTVLGSNTIMSVRSFDNSSGLGVILASATAANVPISFSTVLGSDDVINFTADNGANDGSAECEIEVQERPA